MRFVLALGAACLLAASACHRDTTPVPVPTPIGQPTTTDHFTGTLKVLGSNLHSFKVTDPSYVNVTLTSLNTVAVAADPTANPPIVASPSVPVSYPLILTVGQPTLTTLGVQCSSLLSVSAQPGTTPQLQGQALAGTYCVSISDPNNVLPGPVVYTIDVGHS